MLQCTGLGHKFWTICCLFCKYSETLYIIITYPHGNHRKQQQNGYSLNVRPKPSDNSRNIQRSHGNPNCARVCDSIESLGMRYCRIPSHNQGFYNLPPLKICKFIFKFIYLRKYLNMHSKQPKRLTTFLKKYCDCVLWHRTYFNPCMSCMCQHYIFGGEVKIIMQP